MASIEASYAFKTGKNVFVCTYSTYDANVFIDKVVDTHEKVNDYLPHQPTTNTVVTVFGVPATDKHKGAYRDLIIFDSSYSEFCAKGYAWRQFAKTISIYSHTAPTEMFTTWSSDYKIFDMGQGMFVEPCCLCPKCSYTMTKKRTEGLFLSGDAIEIMKCTNCGYCN
jgi:hypothetical protein